jgi:threonine dehydrogenase-like Zn-dependent dehydrogenase
MLGGSRVEVVEVDVPRPEPGQVLIKVRASALCGSEMGGFRAPDAQPANGGHEVVGEVADACGHPCLRDGDRVAIHAPVSCGHCYWCLRGYELFCERMTTGTPGHADYVAHAAHHCLPVPEDLTWDQALMVGGDTVGVAYHSATRAGVRAGDVAAVLGVGPVGLGCALLLSFWGLRVAAVDIAPYRLDLARKLGAEVAINPSTDDALAALRSLGDGRGPDFVFDCAGSPQTLDLAMQSARKGGTVLIIGERGECPVYPSRDIIHSELRILGSWYFLRSDFPHMVDQTRRGLGPERLVTHHFPLDRAQEAFDLMAAGECGKIVFTEA